SGSSPGGSASASSAGSSGDEGARSRRRRRRTERGDGGDTDGDGGGRGPGDDGRQRARRRLDVDDDAASAGRAAGVGAADGVPPPGAAAAAGDRLPPDADADGVGETDDFWPRPSAEDYAAVARAGVVVHASALHASLFGVLFYRVAPVDGPSGVVPAVATHPNGAAEGVATGAPADRVYPAARCAPRAFAAGTAAFYLLLPIAPWTMDRLTLTAAFTDAARARFGARNPDGGFRVHPSPPMMLAAAAAAQFVVALGGGAPADGPEGLLHCQQAASRALRTARRLLGMGTPADAAADGGALGGGDGNAFTAGLSPPLVAVSDGGGFPDARLRSRRSRRTLGGTSTEWRTASGSLGRGGHGAAALRPRRLLRGGSGRVGGDLPTVLHGGAEEEEGADEAFDDAMSGVAATEGAIPSAPSSVWSFSSRFRSRRSLLSRSSRLHGERGGGGGGGCGGGGSILSRDGPTASEVASISSEAAGEFRSLRARYQRAVSSREHHEAEAALVWSRVASVAINNVEDFTRVASTAATVGGNTKMGSADASTAAACRTAARRGLVASLYSVATALASAPPGTYPYLSPLYCRLVLMLSDAAKVAVIPIDASWCSSDRARAVGMQEDGTYVAGGEDVRPHAAAGHAPDGSHELYSARHRSSPSDAAGSDHSSYPDSEYDEDRCSDAECHCNTIGGGCGGGTPGATGAADAHHRAHGSTDAVSHVRLVADKALPEYGACDDDSFVDDEAEVTDRTRPPLRRPAWEGGRALDEPGGATTQQVLRELAEAVLTTGGSAGARPEGLPFGGNDAVDYAPHGQHREYDRFYAGDAGDGEDVDELAEADAADRACRPDVSDEARRTEREVLLRRLWRRRWERRGGRRPDAAHVGDEFAGALAAVTACLVAAVGTRRASRDLTRSALAAIACDTRVREHVYHTRAHVGAALELGHERHHAAMRAAFEAQQRAAALADASASVAALRDAVEAQIGALMAAAAARVAADAPTGGVGLTLADERQVLREARRCLQRARGAPVDAPCGERHAYWAEWVQSYMASPEGGGHWVALGYAAAVDAACATAGTHAGDTPYYYEDGGGPAVAPDGSAMDDGPAGGYGTAMDVEPGGFGRVDGSLDGRLSDGCSPVGRYAYSEGSPAVDRAAVSPLDGREYASPEVYRRRRSPRTDDDGAKGGDPADGDTSAAGAGSPPTPLPAVVTAADLPPVPPGLEALHTAAVHAAVLEASHRAALGRALTRNLCGCARAGRDPTDEANWSRARVAATECFLRASVDRADAQAAAEAAGVDFGRLGPLAWFVADLRGAPNPYHWTPPLPAPPPAAGYAPPSTDPADDNDADDGDDAKERLGAPRRAAHDGASADAGAAPAPAWATPGRPAASPLPLADPRAAVSERAAENLNALRRTQAAAADGGARGDAAASAAGASGGGAAAAALAAVAAATSATDGRGGGGGGAVSPDRPTGPARFGAPTPTFGAGMSPTPDVDDLPPSPARSARASERSPDRGGASPMDTRPDGAAGAAAAAATAGATPTGGGTPGATGNVLEDAAVDTVLAAVTAAPAVVRRWYEGVSVDEEQVAAASLSGAGTPAAASPRTIALSTAAVQAPPMEERAIKELGRCLALLLTAVAAASRKGASAAAATARLARDVEAVASPTLRSLHAAALSHAAAT
ncbi:hypothetical protein BU14_1590s0001, partial [Porphyra umbilicalis]